MHIEYLPGHWQVSHPSEQVVGKMCVENLMPDKSVSVCSISLQSQCATQTGITTVTMFT